MAPKIEHAKLIPMEDGIAKIDKAIQVQFNPNSLKVNLSNSLKASEGNEENKSQYIDSSSSKLSIELIFDSTSDNTDVRKKTIAITEEFMTPQSDENQAPKVCRFLWGSFQFDGMLQDYDETLDFFAPEGIPLRATIALNFIENKYQFTILDKKVKRDTPSLTANGQTSPVNSALQKTGQNNTDWRTTALYNGIESPRFPQMAVISVPNVQSQAVTSVKASAGINSSANSGISAGFNMGLSASLGTSIAGAFKVKS